MTTTMRVLAACGMLGAATGAASADGGVRVGIKIGPGLFGIRIGEPVACQPVPEICRPEPVCHPEPVVCEPCGHCGPVRYREEVVWENVPRTEVWYDACGTRHERVVYVRECRTIRVPILCEHRREGGWRGGHDGRGRDHGRGEPDRRDWRDDDHRREWGQRGERAGDDRDARRGDREDRDDGRSGREDRRSDQGSQRAAGKGAVAQTAPAGPVAKGAKAGAPTAAKVIGPAGRGRADKAEIAARIKGAANK